jgi:hypothetical protein
MNYLLSVKAALPAKRILAMRWVRWRAAEK